MFLPAPGKMLKEKLFQAIGFCIVKIMNERKRIFHTSLTDLIG
jgi:hypothetical protein